MKASVIPNFVKAKSPEDLRRAMMSVQVSLQRKVHWFDINFDGKNWVAWYEDNYG